MTEKKFDPKRLDKLNDPRRLSDLPPSLIWSRLNLAPPETIVDIGAGTGFFAKAFVPFLKKESDAGRVFACDISDTMLSWINEHICPEFPAIHPVKMTETAVPLADGTADLVYMINLHHELESPEAILGESHRLLTERGVLFLADWKKEDMSQGPPRHRRCRTADVADQVKQARFAGVRVFEDLPRHFLIVAQAAV